MRRVLDTSVLIQFWKVKALSKSTAQHVRLEAENLIVLHKSSAIVTPVYIEMVAGAQNKAELKLTQAFLAPFQVIDQWNVLKDDWVAARALAERVPPSGRPRHLGDCLIEAIANRLNYEVFALDTYF